MKIEKFPSVLKDVSDMIEIEDNQEIFSNVSELNKAQSGY
jgi:hypothetical protein